MTRQCHGGLLIKNVIAHHNFSKNDRQQNIIYSGWWWPTRDINHINATSQSNMWSDVSQTIFNIYDNFFMWWTDISSCTHGKSGLRVGLDFNLCFIRYTYTLTYHLLTAICSQHDANIYRKWPCYPRGGEWTFNTDCGCRDTAYITFVKLLRTRAQVI